uniref:Uncharacterized protein n=1 Tax=Peronospora matthiolae TaxID=2874970 RepID=A0AAV1T9X6_9STRA
MVDYDDHPAIDNMSLSSVVLSSDKPVTSVIPEPVPASLSGPSPCSAEIVSSPREPEATKPLLIKEAFVNGKKCRLLIDCGAPHDVIKPKVYDGQRKPVTVHVTSFNGENVTAQTSELKTSEKIDGLHYNDNVNPITKWTEQIITYRQQAPHANLADDLTDKEAQHVYAELCSVKVTRPMAIMLPPGVKQLIHKFADLIPASLPTGLTPVRDVEHAVIVNLGALPTSRLPFRMAPVEKVALSKFVDELLAKKWIQFSSSEWVSNIFAVPKKDPSRESSSRGLTGFAVDFEQIGALGERLSANECADRGAQDPTFENR